LASSRFASAALVAELVRVAITAPTNGAAPIERAPAYAFDDSAAPTSTLKGAAIASVGASLPETVVPSAQIAAKFGVDADWIVRRTGIHERRFASPGERLSAHAARAALRALERADVRPAAVDLVLVATTTPDELLPNAAPLVAAQIGARGAGAFDVGAACTGFLSALAAGCAYIESRRAGCVVVVGADFMSRITDPDDRATAALFADGAGAVVLLPTAAPGRIGPVVLGSDGDAADKIVVEHAPAKIQMQGQDTFREAVERLSSVTVEAAAAAGVALDEIDLFVYHQANRRILQAIGERLALGPERVVDCIGEHGNTSAASLPLALAHSDERYRLHAGDRVLLGAFGAGTTWGATVVQWGADSVDRTDDH
jgi:3-oxoacyl-[acyl-carrier-protein] synthase-3